jgi:peroxiredoxin Q/BCP
LKEALLEGKKAPDFDLPASSGGLVSPKGLKGKAFVLYFYPKDDTPGCTVEACEFGAGFPAFEKLGVPIFGISPDSLESHAKFIKKFKLPFTLLADEDHAVTEAYGVWVEKSMYGRTFMGVQRSTFLVDADGKFAKIWPKVKPEGHAQEVLEAIKLL